MEINALILWSSKYKRKEMRYKSLPIHGKIFMPILLTNVEISTFTVKQLSFASLHYLSKIVCRYNNLPLSFVMSSLVSSRAWMTHIWWPGSHWQDKVWDTLMSNTYRNRTTLMSNTYKNSTTLRATISSKQMSTK